MKDKIDKAIECFKNKDWNSAIDLFTSVLEVETDSAEVYNNLGLCYANIGDDEKAEKNYLRCIELNPELAQCYINLVDLYYKQRRLGEGINILSYAIDMLPDDIIFRHYLARFYMEDAKGDLAIDELTYILERQPDNYDAYYDFGWVGVLIFSCLFRVIHINRKRFSSLLILFYPHVVDNVDNFLFPSVCSLLLPL